MVIWSYHQCILHNTSPAHSSQPPQISAYSVSFSCESQLLLSSTRGHKFTHTLPVAHSLHHQRAYFEEQLTVYSIPSRAGWGEMGELWSCSDNQKCCTGSLLTRYGYSQGCIMRTEERKLPSCVANQALLHQRASVVDHPSPPPSLSLLPELPISMAPPSGGVTIATGSDSSLRWCMLPKFSFTCSAFPIHPLFCARNSSVEWCCMNRLYTVSLRVNSLGCQMKLEEVEKETTTWSSVFALLRYGINCLIMSLNLEM